MKEFGVALKKKTQNPVLCPVGVSGNAILGGLTIS